MYANFPAVTHPGFAQALQPIGAPLGQPQPIFFAPRIPVIAGADQRYGNLVEMARTRPRRDEPKRCFDLANDESLMNDQVLMLGGMPFRKVIVEVPCPPAPTTTTTELPPCATATEYPRYTLTQRYVMGIRDNLCPKKKCKED